MSSNARSTGDSTSNPQPLLKSYSDLLESGLFSDAEVRCGSRTWKVHKAILCTRSKWFKKALMGHFEESATGIVTIEICSEDEVNLLLHYLYTGVVDLKKHLPGDSLIISQLKAWKMAGFFCLPKLQRIILQARDNFLIAMTKSYGMQSELQDGQMCSIAREVQLLYADDSEGVKDTFRLPFLAVLLLGIRFLAKEKEIRKLLREIPGFASDWALGLMGGLDSGHHCRSEKQYFCGRCRLPAVDYSPVKFRAWVEVEKEVFCGPCVSAPTWEDWVGKATEGSGTSK